MKKKTNNVPGLLLVALSAVLMAVSGAVSCAQDSTAQKVQGTELREYNGEKLDPVSKFEENSIKGPQHVKIAKYKLKVEGLVAKPAEYTYEQVIARPAQARVVTHHCVEGWDVKALWEGISLKDLLAEAEVKPEAKTVIFKCYDGYTTSVALADVTNNDYLLAFKINGLTLPPERGYPLALVASTKWGYKSARWITTIELSANANYKGFWERNGYNTNGDLTGPIFEERRR